MASSFSVGAELCCGGGIYVCLTRTSIGSLQPAPDGIGHMLCGRHHGSQSCRTRYLRCGLRPIGFCCTHFVCGHTARRGFFTDGRVIACGAMGWSHGYTASQVL